MLSVHLIKAVLRRLRAPYHFLLALAAALLYRFPARKIYVLGVTGTKGKTTTTELVNALLETSGEKTALSNSLRFKIGRESEPNRLKMTMPGRFFLQGFLRRAVAAGCRYAVIEMTSGGAVQYRHAFTALNALIFTNLAPEHIESHGSFDAYRAAKLKLFDALARSKKSRRLIVVNEDDENARYFLRFTVEEKRTFRLEDAVPYEVKREGITFTFEGEKINAPLSGKMNLMNMLAAATFVRAEGVPMRTIKQVLESFRGVDGRLERITLPVGDPLARGGEQNFIVVVDYAHTPDSLEKVYEAFGASRLVCVLGACGGGRDKWKRPELGRIAARACDEIILTNEDPYDEDPQTIVEEIARGVGEEKDYKIVLDRREAIFEAVSRAQTGDTVIITGKGAEPWLMGPRGTKIPWDDRALAREALRQRSTSNA